jgi:hypothetical protein
MCQKVVQITGWGTSPEWTNRARRSITKWALKQLTLQSRRQRQYAPQKRPRTSIRLKSITSEKIVQQQPTPWKLQMSHSFSSFAVPQNDSDWKVQLLLLSLRYTTNYLCKWRRKDTQIIEKHRHSMFWVWSADPGNF